jgi:hypothetical protein
MPRLGLLLSSAAIISACVNAEAPPITEEPSGGNAGVGGATGSGGSGNAAGTGGAGAVSGAGGTPIDGSAGAVDAAGSGGSSAGSAGSSGTGAAAGTGGGGSESCSGERFITPCNGTTATRCVNDVVEQVECGACSKLSFCGACCGDVHPYVLDQNFTSQGDRFSNFNQSAASVEFDFGGDDWQGAIGWFFNPAASSISAVRVQASVSGSNAEPPFVTLEREGAGCEYALDDSGNAMFPGANCWGGFNPNDVAWVAVRTKSTGAGRVTLTVTSINITP